MIRVGVTITAIMAAMAGCRRGGAEGAEGGVPPAPGDRIVATINGLPVMREDYEAALKAGRVGGSPELVLDEMLSFTLVLNECRAMGEKDCDGPAPLHERALRFLGRLYDAETACRNLTDREIEEFLRGREVRAAAGREAAMARLCEARAKRMRRQWVTALRKNAIVEILMDPQ